jgi:hypothetical protein
MLSLHLNGGADGVSPGGVRCLVDADASRLCKCAFEAIEALGRVELSIAVLVAGRERCECDGWFRPSLFRKGVE